MAARWYRHLSARGPRLWCRPPAHHHRRRLTPLSNGVSHINMYTDSIPSGVLIVNALSWIVWNRVDLEEAMLLMPKKTEKITLQEAFLRYRVPIPTLRSWIDKQELPREYDNQRRLVLAVPDLERRIERWRATLAQRPGYRGGE
jgi:hypothetical protein